MTVTWLPNCANTEANSTPIAPLPRMTMLFGTSRSFSASSLVMMRWRSISMPGTPARAGPGGDDDLPGGELLGIGPVTSTVPCPSRRAVPLIQSILFFLNRKAMPAVSSLTTLSLRAWIWPMSNVGWAPPNEMPQSFACWTTFQACACSSRALVGMQPQFRQVPPSARLLLDDRHLEAELGARMAATYPPVPAPITTTSY